MANVSKTKLYAYVDESGQDTEGKFFIVSIVVLGKEQDDLIEKLEDIERKSGKRNIKWHKARREYRKSYVDALLHLQLLRQKIFFEFFTNSTKYFEMASFATAKAILSIAPKEYLVSVFVDGLNKQEIAVFERGLRALRIKKRKVKGVRREENNSLIRLADAICGLIRDGNQEDMWAKEIVKKFIKKRTLTVL